MLVIDPIEFLSVVNVTPSPNIPGTYKLAVFAKDIRLFVTETAGKPSRR